MINAPGFGKRMAIARFVKKTKLTKRLTKL
jgi:hypothetical protein